MTTQIETQTKKTVSELIRHFEVFTSNYSVIGENEMTNHETLFTLRKMDKKRVFCVMNDEVDRHCLLIWKPQQ